MGPPRDNPEINPRAVLHLDNHVTDSHMKAHLDHDQFGAIAKYDFERSRFGALHSALGRRPFTLDLK